MNKFRLSYITLQQTKRSGLSSVMTINHYIYLKKLPTIWNNPTAI